MSWSEAVAKAAGLDAIVSLPVASLRARPDPRSELVSQEIYGKPVHISKVTGDWCLCVAPDSTTGWIHTAYLSPYAHYLPRHQVSTRFAALTLRGRSDLALPMGSLVQVTRMQGRTWQVSTPDGVRGSMTGSSLRSHRALRLSGRSFSSILRRLIGAPYLWGGKSTFGFDCSGLVQSLYEVFGIRLPRDSQEQARCGRRVAAIGLARPFDLLFFEERGVVNHVAIHMGGLQILHASGCVKVESLDATSDSFRVDLLDRFAFARRVAAA